MFDGSLQNSVPVSMQGLAFGGLMLGVVFAWAGLIFGYGLLNYQVWAWIGLLILQIMNAFASLHAAWEWINMVVSHMSQYPAQPLPHRSGSWLLWVQITLSLTIIELLFRSRKAVFKS